jgi:two-component system chemotaxis response regulator CheB
MPQIKVLVVDDSTLSREMLTTILSSDKDIHVAGQAANGREALEMVVRLKPDIITMDIEMPVMNGLDALERIMATNPVPTLVVSSRGDAGTAYSAVSKGALEIISKGEIDPENPDDLIQKIKLLSRVKVITHLRTGQAGKNVSDAQRFPEPRVQAGAVGQSRLKGERHPPFKVVAIASSTGGPKALSELLINFPSQFSCPIVIAQHISDGFISGMVEWLGKLTQLKVKVGEDGDQIAPGTVYVSPSERHMKINPDRRIRLVNRSPGDLYHPSCDILLSSIAQTFGSSSIGVILTGMGSDGAVGMERIKAAGGMTIAQDEKSSAIFGMPKVAIGRGCIDKVLSLDAIAGQIIGLVGSRN